MIRSFLTVALLVLPFAAANAQEDLPPRTDLGTLKQKASYGIGLNIGRNIAQSMKRDGVDVDVNLFTQGIADALTGADPKLTQEELLTVMRQFEVEMEKQMEAKRLAVGKANAEKGAKFLAENRSKPGVKSLENGIQYKEIKAGDGPMPKQTDTVRAHYEGTLIDGTVFDSSYERGQPATFPLGRVIEGWRTSVSKMNVGDTWIIYVPSELAYKEAGAGTDIGPNETLIFKIELLGIQ